MSSPNFSRRALLSGLLATACSRKRAPRYQGWLFVASGKERAVAVANLAQFRPVTSIALPHAPDRLLIARSRVYAVSREGAELIEIDPAGFRVTGTIALPGKPLSAQLLPGGDSLLVSTEEPATVVAVDLIRRRVSARLNLPAVPADAALGSGLSAVSLPARQTIMRISAPDLKPAGENATGAPAGTLRFRQDGKTILAGLPGTREVITLDSATGNLLARLPLPIEPQRFCFNPDGGQMFVTGTGEDSLVIVNPYQNEVDQTILAGRTPGAMAVSARQNLLFVANIASGDLTILDIETRHPAASVHVGGNPGEVLLTPDGEYALAIEPASGTVSVVRVATALDRSQVALVARPPKPLFTVFQSAADARAAIIVPFNNAG